MINVNQFIQGNEYKELKSYLFSLFIDKPLSIKTDGRDDRAIAIEVRASQIAVDKLLKGFKKFEKQATPVIKKAEPFR